MRFTKVIAALRGKTTGEFTSMDSPGTFRARGGNDTVIGSDGNDQIYGGAGADTLVVDEELASWTLIRDFETGVDTVEFLNSDATQFSDLGFTIWAGEPALVVDADTILAFEGLSQADLERLIYVF